ncbi:exonuclease [Lactobacillus phage 521B]|uniref:Exonuclease n=1 Tax=Lactobacillus phage 521B TaxID=2510942 RepID=A0A4Y5FGB3_9CAUD|nr:exonuclease [Lactobacillus phage 521B]QBJ03507.1 exonuclease [Lactobacillus phage 521B]
MIKYKNVEANNFLSYDHFNLNLDNQGLILIEGINNSDNSFKSNGSGKTSALSAITYALYGITLNNTKGNDVVNRQSNKNCWVKLTFESGKDVFVIERYRKDKDNKNKVKLFANSEEITESSNAKTDETIGKLIGVDFDTYVNAVVYSNNFSEKSFMQASDKGKKEILETLANTTIYSTAKQNSIDKRKEIDDSIKDLENALYKVNTDIDKENELYTYKTSEYNKSINSKDSLESSLKEKESRYNTFHIKNNYNLKKLIGIKESLLDSFNRYKQVLNEKNSVGNAINSEKMAINNLKSQYTQYKDMYNEEIAKYNKLNTSPYCYVCGAKLDSNHLKKEQDSIITKGKDIHSKLDNIKKEAYASSERLKSLNKKYLSYSVEDKDYAGEINRIDNEINTIKSNENKLSSEVQALKISINNLTLEKPVKNEKKLADLENYKEELNEKIQKMTNRRDKFDVLAKRVFSDSGIKSYLMDMITPFLNNHANNYLNRLTNGDISIELLTQTETKSGDLRDKMDVIVSSKNGADSYASCSAGEKKRIELAMAFAIQDLLLSQSNLSVNTAIYDECFDGLDSIGCENVIDILKDKQKQLGSIYVISHNEYLKPLFSHIVTVEKDKNGISKIKEN